jgi:phosphoserine aminotransferase
MNKVGPLRRAVLVYRSEVKMTVKELIELLLRVPESFEVLIYRGGAYSSVEGVEVNEDTREVFVSNEKDELR